MSEFDEGDFVEAVKDRSRIEGIFRPTDQIGYAWVGTVRIDDFPKWTVTVIKKAALKVELPTEPGWYESQEFPLGTSANYDPYSLATDGQWYSVDEHPLTPEDMRRQGKLRRLEPVPVTAKRVLDAIDASFTPGVVRLFTYADAAKVAASFGVRS